jgi:hypothetical protein
MALPPRVLLMLTTGFIMFVGVLFDIGVWYYAKPLVIFGPEESTKGSILRNPISAENLSHKFSSSNFGQISTQNMKLYAHYGQYIHT